MSQTHNPILPPYIVQNAQHRHHIIAGQVFGGRAATTVPAAVQGAQDYIGQQVFGGRNGRCMSGVSFPPGAVQNVLLRSDTRPDGIFWGDHGDIAGLGDDDHVIYLPVNGTRGMLARLDLDASGGCGFTDLGFGSTLDIRPALMNSVSTAWTLGHVEARFTGTLFVSTTGAGNVGGGEDDLISWTMPANTLNTNGFGIEILAGGTIANNTNSKRLRMKFGATTLLDSGAAVVGNGAWWAQAIVLRTGSTTQKASAKLVAQGTTIAQWNDLAAYAAPGESLTGTVIIKLTGEATADNDISQEWMLVRFL
jgi:hypothetical protein